MEAAGYDRSIELIELHGPGSARPTGPAGHWRRIQWDSKHRLLALPPGIRLDFGGIGKGFAVDFALRSLVDTGCGVLVSAGGDIGCCGPAPEEGWICEVAASPDSPAETIVALRNGAMATSGLGRRQWLRDGERLHHLIDPHTGRPGTSPWQFVTVVTSSCAVAEVAAKVAWLKGESGPDFIDGLQMTARFSDGAGRVTKIGAWPESEVKE
jgi:thiamine biosynthesis lipoprotein